MYLFLYKYEQTEDNDFTWLILEDSTCGWYYLPDDDQEDLVRELQVSLSLPLKSAVIPDEHLADLSIECLTDLSNLYTYDMREELLVNYITNEIIFSGPLSAFKFY